MKGTLSKKQRDRKKMREIAHFAFINKNEHWTRFVKEANKGNRFAEVKQDREEADKILKSWHPVNRLNYLHEEGRS